MMNHSFKPGDIVYSLDTTKDYDSVYDFGTLLYLGDAFDDHEDETRPYFAYVFSSDSSILECFRSTNPSNYILNFSVYENSLIYKFDKLNPEPEHLREFYNMLRDGQVSLRYDGHVNRTSLVFEEPEGHKHLRNILLTFNRCLTNTNQKNVAHNFHLFKDTREAFNAMARFNRFHDIPSRISIPTFDGPSYDITKEDVFRYYDSVVSDFLKTYNIIALPTLFNPPKTSL